MGQVHAEIELVSGEDLLNVRRGNLDMDEIKKIRITALADTGAIFLCINENIQEYLQLPVMENRRFQLADGKTAQYLVVGPVDIRFQNRQASCDAIVLPGDAEPLLGCIPMEAMDVLIDPLRQELVVNPKHPDYAVHRL
ncbi:MAG TPA: aspartyl protease family protein [Puia sp.]|nr:aspartyl protease family protein [Puia sp.]